MISWSIKSLLNLVSRPLLIRLSIVLRPIIIWFYKGDKFIDPIDGRGYRKFLPYGYGKIRQNALSPGTLSLERHRQMWLYLQRETDLFTKPQKVLHIAPEQEIMRRLKKVSHLDYITTDLFSPIVDVKADILHLPFKDNEFDVVLCNHVLEHIIDDQKAMSELYRVMRPQGWGIAQVPLRWNTDVTYEDFNITDPKERQKHFGQYDHVRIYGRDYLDRLRKVGFLVTALKNYEMFDEKEIYKFSLIKDEILPIIKKL